MDKVFNLIPYCFMSLNSLVRLTTSLFGMWHIISWIGVKWVEWASSSGFIEFPLITMSFLVQCVGYCL